MQTHYDCIRPEVPPADGTNDEISLGPLSGTSLHTGFAGLGQCMERILNVFEAQPSVIEQWVSHA